MGANHKTRKDLTGTRFGRWKVLGFSHKDSRNQPYWDCECDCGTIKKVRGSGLTRKLSLSCGCLHKEIASNNMRKLFSGDKNYGWNGGRTKTTCGYIKIKMPEHPNADRHGYVAEHRLVIEKDIGRYLLPKETVHHKNGIRDDNRVENLELRTYKHFPGTSISDIVEHAIYVLGLYAPDKLKD